MALRARPYKLALAAVAATLWLPISSPAAASTPSHSPAVLRVGSWNGISGQYSSVQAAVRAAHAGDWVLVGPGDYKENGYQGQVEPAGVLITTPGLHLRGMDRNRVVVDGTQSGSPACSPRKADQRFTSTGRDGIMDLKVNGVTIENLTVCNYLTSSAGKEGNQIWFNGGDGSGRIGMGNYGGDYLTATSTYSAGVSNPRGEYGIFSSNDSGSGLIDHSYASNMGDSAYYIGACPDCNQTLRHAHGQFSALGYSGTNSGGRLVIEDSEFDRNKTGATTNSQNNDDAPSPLNGSCPAGSPSPLGNGICSIWRDNYFHDNNNPNVPGVGDGLAGGAPVGTGLLFAGTQNVAAYHNRFVNNGAWGMIVTDLPDQETPPADIGQNCQGGTYVVPPGTGVDPLCYFPAFGNAIINNVFSGNGTFSNPTNADIAIFHVVVPFDPAAANGNCVSGNTDTGGLSSDPLLVQTIPTYNDCTNRPKNLGNPNPVLAAELNCAGGLLTACPDLPLATYPRTTKVVLARPASQPTMPEPCAGVPVNPWCPVAAPKPAGATVGRGSAGPLTPAGLPNTTIPTGVAAGYAKPAAPPHLPFGLLVVGLLIASGGAAAWKLRGRHIT